MSHIIRILSAALLIVVLTVSPTAFAKDKKMSGPELVEVADVSVGLSGLVCDFCAIALNKTFKKRKEVSGTYVDLDTKTLSVTFYDGKSLDDKAITKLVKRAGYSVTGITRNSDGSVAIAAQ